MMPSYSQESIEFIAKILSWYRSIFSKSISIILLAAAVHWTLALSFGTRMKQKHTTVDEFTLNINRCNNLVHSTHCRNLAIIITVVSFFIYDNLIQDVERKKAAAKEQDVKIFAYRKDCILWLRFTYTYLKWSLYSHWHCFLNLLKREEKENCIGGSRKNEQAET